MKIPCKFSNLESDFFPTFQRKSRMFQIIRNLFCLNYIWANFEQDQRRFFSKIFQLGIGFFSNFPTKVANVPNNSKFILSELHLSEVWARLEDLFSEKKGLPSSVFLKKNSKNFRNFQLGIGFFSNFPMKSSNIPNNSKIIFFEPHLSQFSAKLEKLFWSLTHSVSRYHSLRSRFVGNGRRR